VAASDQDLTPRDGLATLRHLVGKAVADYGMIDEGDRIVVGISGGVDSMVLMHVLDALRRAAPIRFDLVPAIVDMGFEGITPEKLTDYFRGNGWELVVEPMREGAALIREKGDPARPCGICSRLRRGKLHAVADRLGCGTIALGQHLDDMAVSLLMSLFRGTGLKTMAPICAADNGTKKLIRPLCYATKQTILDAGAGYAFPDVGACDYGAFIDRHGDRAFLERLVDDLDNRFAGIRKAMLNSMQDVRPDHLLDRRYLGC
jgi:tRNA 2-thiocytidine biosynthesis protein TtcA